MKIHLIRHAAAIMDDEILSIDDVGLSDQGKKEIKIKLIPFIKEQSVEFILTSPINRTMQTAALLSTELGLPLKTDERFIEFSFGDANGKNYQTILKNLGLPKSPAGLFFAEEELRMHNYFNVESYESVTKRVIDALLDIERSKKETAVITHGELIRAVIAQVKGDKTILLRRIKIPTCSSITLEVTNSEFSILNLNLH